MEVIGIVLIVALVVVVTAISYLVTGWAVTTLFPGVVWPELTVLTWLAYVWLNMTVFASSSGGKK